MGTGGQEMLKSIVLRRAEDVHVFSGFDCMECGCAVGCGMCCRMQDEQHGMRVISVVYVNLCGQCLTMWAM